ncbi:MAG TPA: hypothetical protein VGB04_11705 [Allosphingosinicella sp.]|jgi:DNA-directed RNA polymerase subunit RPC12/RpoP
MKPALRDKLPWLVAAAWIGGTWKLELGAPSLKEMLAGPFWARFASDYSELDAVGWLAMLLAAMFVADRLLFWYGTWRWGVDPMKVHWSRLRNREGKFLCAACLSPFLLPPTDYDDEGVVRCGDCGHEIAPYREFKAYAPGIVRRAVGSWTRRLRG